MVAFFYSSQVLEPDLETLRGKLQFGKGLLFGDFCDGTKCFNEGKTNNK
jgi:hypothetical protein